MKMHIWLAPLLIMLLFSCKKSNEANTSMYVAVNNSTWTTDHVVTYRTANNDVFIMATNRETNERITLRLGEYRERETTYPIYVRSILADKNSAQYENNKYVLVADAGKIEVSKFTGNGMEGSFDFYDGGNRIQGYFSAYKP